MPQLIIVYCFRATIIDALQTDFKSDPSVGLAYFFFTFSEPDKQAVLNMLTALVAQLFLWLLKIPEGLKAIYTRHPEKPLLTTLLRIFDILLMEFNWTYIILDALDEVATHDRGTLLSTLHQMLDGSFANLNVLLTSRQEQYILEGLNSLMVTKVTMNTQVVDGDIRRFISETLLRDSKFQKWDSSIRMDIETALVNGAQGMYVNFSFSIIWL